MRKLILMPLFFLMACAGAGQPMDPAMSGLFTSTLPFLGCAMTGKIMVVVDSNTGEVTPRCAPQDLIPITCPTGKYLAEYNIASGKYDFKCMEETPSVLGGEAPIISPTE